MGATPNILENAKKVLDNAKNFTNQTTAQAGNKTNPFEPPAPKAPSPSAYSHVRQMRKAPDEFLGLKASEGKEMKSAFDQREQAKKDLAQPQ
jgi:hypothetical protein